ncbi:MAG: hypothetical protein JSS07_05090 [Proteobacteria bacterium]|nr:hypothetical protein [Pseudomonadota bacterium]
MKKAVVLHTYIIFSLLLLGCKAELNTSLSPFQHVSLKRPFDAMPREGWATDPNFSYRFYSYYPMDFVHGGINQPYYHNPILY